MQHFDIAVLRGRFVAVGLVLLGLLCGCVMVVVVGVCVLAGCCSGIARLLAGCCAGVARVLCGCYAAVARVLLECCLGVGRVLLKCW